MIRLLVKKETMESALRYALEDVKEYANAYASKVMLSLYVVRERDEIRGTAFIITAFIFENLESDLESDLVLDEIHIQHGTRVYETDMGGGKELLEFLETKKFKSDIPLSKEEIEKMLEFLNGKEAETIEIIHSKYIGASFIKCNNEIMKFG